LQGLKIKYPKEDSGILSLVAVACFLIDKGCDWTATNKKGRTAAEILPLFWIGSTFAKIFKKECDEHHLSYHSYVKNNAQGTPKYLLVGNTLHGPDSNGRMSSITLEGI
jgi:hypothetical protein